MRLPSCQGNHRSENEVAQRGEESGWDKMIPIPPGPSCCTVSQLHSFLRSRQLPLAGAARKLANGERHRDVPTGV